VYVSGTVKHNATFMACDDDRLASCKLRPARLFFPGFAADFISAEA
jgi:hypothetical protein